MRNNSDCSGTKERGKLTNFIDQAKKLNGEKHFLNFDLIYK